MIISARVFTAAETCVLRSSLAIPKSSSFARSRSTPSGSRSATIIPLSGFKSVKHKLTFPSVKCILRGGKGLVFVDRCQKISVFLITFRRCRYSGELDRLWELIRGRCSAWSACDLVSLALRGVVSAATQDDGFIRKSLTGATVLADS